MISPIEIMIDNAGLKCTICGTDIKTGCDCWAKCECGVSNPKGAQCRNLCWHTSMQFAQDLAEEVVADMGNGYKTFQEGSVSSNQNIIGRLKRTIVRRSHSFFMSCFEGVESAELDQLRQKEAKE